MYVEIIKKIEKLLTSFSRSLRLLLNEVKPTADATDFLKVAYRASSIKIRAQIRRGEFD
jgi:hypothetical protein